MALIRLIQVEMLAGQGGEEGTAAREHSELTGLYWLTNLATNQTWPVYRNINCQV